MLNTLLGLNALLRCDCEKLFDNVNVKNENRKVVKVVRVQPGRTLPPVTSFLWICARVWRAWPVARAPRILVVQPGLLFGVKLFQIPQRDVLLLLPAQTLHTELKNTPSCPA